MIVDGFFGGGVIDDHYACLTYMGIQHWIFPSSDSHPSTYQPPTTGHYFGEQSGTTVLPWHNNSTF